MLMYTGGMGALHVAIVTRSVIAHHPAGGMELHTEILRNGLVRRGNVVTTITTAHPDRTSAIRDEWGDTLFAGNGPAGRYSREWWRASVDALAELHERHPIDVVLSQSAAAYGYLRSRSRIASRARVPVAHITHGSVASDLEMHIAQFSRRPLSTLRWAVGACGIYALDARYLPRAEAVAALSPVIRGQLCRWFHLDPRRVHVIPNGVDVRRCLDAASQRARARADLNIGADTCLVLGVGNLAPHKGFHHLLDACAQLQRASAEHNISVALVGDGSMSRELHIQAASGELSGRVLFTGRVSPDRVPPLLWAADIVAMPSLKEGVPLTLLEAMACARPVVATRVGGIPDVVEDGHTGLLVPPARPAALAQALAQLARDRAAANQMGARAQARAVDEYDQERMVDRYDRLVRRMASEVSRSGRP